MTLIFGYAMCLFGLNVGLAAALFVDGNNGWPNAAFAAAFIVLAVAVYRA